jgi:hypothetical protein
MQRSNRCVGQTLTGINQRENHACDDIDYLLTTIVNNTWNPTMVSADFNHNRHVQFRIILHHVLGAVLFSKFADDSIHGFGLLPRVWLGTRPLRPAHESAGSWALPVPLGSSALRCSHIAVWTNSGAVDSEHRDRFDREAS